MALFESPVGHALLFDLYTVLRSVRSFILNSRSPVELLVISHDATLALSLAWCWVLLQSLRGSPIYNPEFQASTRAGILWVQACGLAVHSPKHRISVHIDIYSRAPRVHHQRRGRRVQPLLRNSLIGETLSKCDSLVIKPENDLASSHSFDLLTCQYSGSPTPIQSETLTLL